MLHLIIFFFYLKEEITPKTTVVHAPDHIIMIKLYVRIYLFITLSCCMIMLSEIMCLIRFRKTNPIVVFYVRNINKNTRRHLENWMFIRVGNKTIPECTFCMPSIILKYRVNTLGNWIIIIESLFNSKILWEIIIIRVSLHDFETNIITD